jgi:hypothetical protein
MERALPSLKGPFGCVAELVIVAPVYPTADMRSPAHRDLEFFRRNLNVVKRTPVEGMLRDHVSDASHRNLSRTNVDFGGSSRQSKVGPKRCDDKCRGRSPYQVSPYPVALKNRRRGPNHEGGHTGPNGLHERLCVHEPR